MANMVLIAGGIGSGKSTVSRVLECMGYRVYDCDSRAKEIMDRDIAIKREIAERVSPEALLVDMSLDRRHISQVVFSDKEKLSILNEIVHGAVRNDIDAWVHRHDNDRLLFVETAIPRSAGLDMIADYVWMVEAPTDVRIDRVCRRNGLEPESVIRRMEAQQYESEIINDNVSVIINDGRQSLLLQIEALLQSISDCCRGN